MYVIDDDGSVLESMQFLLDSCGIPSKQFTDPYEFLQLANSLPPGCVLTDLRMPTMSGLELHRSLNARSIGWPLVIMSAHLDGDASAHARNSGVFDVIEKPFTAVALTAVLERAFAQLNGAAELR